VVLSFEEAIQLCKMWGFIVEPGPRPAEVSLILEGPDYRTYAVYEASLLPEIVNAALQVRWQKATEPVSAGVEAPGETADHPGGQGHLPSL
jgi:hypothetical protein